jgi:signal transduction histidine kinase
MRAMADRVAAGDYGRTLELDRGDELGALAAALDEMSRKLAEAAALRTRLLHDVSHELRSPLGRIRVLAETLRGRPERLEARVEGIVQEVELLDRIVGDLLESARALPGPGGVEPRRAGLLAWSRDAFPRLAAEAEARRVAWRARVPERELEVEIDPQRLTQALGNLVDNSLHALAGVPGPRLDVTLAVEPEAWSLAVEDNGPGIPPEDQPRVFLRFYRVGEDRARGRGGAGLGLALVEAITTAHGGTVALESEPGVGTKVTLRFPRPAG